MILAMLRWLKPKTRQLLSEMEFNVMFTGRPKHMKLQMRRKPSILELLKLSFIEWYNFWTFPNLQEPVVVPEILFAR